jgi:polysaccharide deacetylase family protein (PEP-CTERM system associated)
MTAVVPPNRDVVNAMTVDVEDYFQVSAFDSCIPRSDWSRWPQHVENNTECLLELFARNGVKATFFVLGWVAERYPALVRRIAQSGHEVASHGFGHERLTGMTPSQFREDIVRAKTILEDLTGTEVAGYRAPSYSIGHATLWAYAELCNAGYRYSSSVVPIRHDLYGMPDAPRFPFLAGDAGLLEVPVTTVTLLGRNWPCGGGGFFRLLPYPLFRWALERVNNHDRRPGIFYCHPWEIDQAQPRVAGVTFKNHVRHYLNIKRMPGKLDCLLRDFQFDRMDHVFLAQASGLYPVVRLEDRRFCVQ